MLKLTEKYRPRVLSDIIGQDKIVSKVQFRLDRGGFGSRAVIIMGKSGQGKTSLAWVIGRTLADTANITEFDAVDCTPYRISEIENAMQIYGMGERNGRVWIINEFYGMDKQSRTKWLTVLERIPDHCCVIFTATSTDAQMYFKECGDKGQFQSRCMTLELEKRDIMPVFAQRALEIARFEGLDGQPLEAYQKLVTDKLGNMRHVLEAIDNGEMLIN